MLSKFKGWLRRLDDHYDEMAVQYPSRWVPASRLVPGAGLLILFALELAFRGSFMFFTLLAGVILVAEGTVLLQRQRRWNI